MTSRSDMSRISKQSSSVLAFEPHSHYSFSSHFINKHNVQDDFEFKRPSDEEVDALFEELRVSRDLGEMPNLTADRKWQLVYTHEQMRWREEKAREEQVKRQIDSGQMGGSYSKDSPEWYVKKFLDQTVTVKHAASLQVSLRTNPLKCAQIFYIVFVFSSSISVGSRSFCQFKGHLY